MTQEVYVSETQTGQPGLFTRGWLAWPLDRAEARRLLAMSDTTFKAYVERLNFVPSVRSDGTIYRGSLNE